MQHNNVRKRLKKFASFSLLEDREENHLTLTKLLNTFENQLNQAGDNKD